MQASVDFQAAPLAESLPMDALTNAETEGSRPCFPADDVHEGALTTILGSIDEFLAHQRGRALSYIPPADSTQFHGR